MSPDTVGSSRGNLLGPRDPIFHGRSNSDSDPDSPPPHDERFPPRFVTSLTFFLCRYFVFDLFPSLYSTLPSRVLHIYSGSIPYGARYDPPNGPFNPDHPYGPHGRKSGGSQHPDLAFFGGGYGGGDYFI